MTDDSAGGLAAFVAGNDNAAAGAPLTRESVDATLARLRDAGRTHWADCWRQRDHHACAVALAERQAVELEQWRARYMAAHDILLRVELVVEDATREPDGFTVDADLFADMRDAFLAYRASIEAGAPLAWAVLEQEVAG